MNASYNKYCPCFICVEMFSIYLFYLLVLFQYSVLTKSMNYAQYVCHIFDQSINANKGVNGKLRG